MSDNYSFLQKVPLFSKLPEPDLEHLCKMVEEVRLPAGTQLFVEGSKGDQIYVIKEGKIEIFKTVEGKKIELAIRQAGDVIGEISLLEAVPRSASGNTLTDVVLIAITQEQFDELLDHSPSAARIMLHTVAERLRSDQLQLKNSDRMAQLGGLTAGIAHELNNPAAAAKRGAEQLRTAIDRLHEIYGQLYAQSLSSEQTTRISDLRMQVMEKALHPARLDSLRRSDLEGELEAWLDAQGVQDAWELAPTLAGLGYETASLEQAVQGFPPEAVSAVVCWLVVNASLYSLLDEIGQGANRISEIVGALKSYVYLDQAPVLTVDVHDGLENTLVILRHKLIEGAQGVEIERRYQADLPRIQAYAGELNQVWTNMIDNAIDAMQGKGKITLTTQFRDPWVVVDIADNGPGIPDAIKEKIFNPFFTTKPIGQGTGLGLNTSYKIIHRHGGEVKVRSKPGDTHLEVWLPVNFEALRRSGSGPAPAGAGSNGSEDR